MFNRNLTGLGSLIAGLAAMRQAMPVHRPVQKRRRKNRGVPNTKVGRWGKRYLLKGGPAMTPTQAIFDRLLREAFKAREAK